jgi:hypothetical protein
MRPAFVAAGVLVAGLFAAGAAALAAQPGFGQPPPGPRAPDPGGRAPAHRARSQHLVVEGCLEGTSLEPLKDDLILQAYNAHEYDLQIPKSLRETLKAHDGHLERVSGTATPPETDDDLIDTRQFGGKTTVTVAKKGSSEMTVGRVLLAVSSIEHVNDSCAALTKTDPSPSRAGSTMPGR